MEYKKKIFFNPEIPGLGLCQSRDFGIKNVRDSGSRDYNPYLCGIVAALKTTDMKMTDQYTWHENAGH